MLSEKNRAYLLFFGIVSSVVLCSASKPVPDFSSDEQIPAPAEAQNKIDIKTIGETKAANTPKEDQESDSRLQKRDWLNELASYATTISNDGVSRGNGNGAIILGNSVIPRGASNFRSASYSGNHLEFDNGRVHVTVHSPGRSQKIAFRGKRAFVNRKLVSNNVDKLDEDPKYQKSADGALWYTNLPVGQEMTEKEIEEFNEEDTKAEEERERVLQEAQEHTAEVLREADRVRVEALREAERATAAAMEQARRAMMMANSFWGWGW